MEYAVIAFFCGLSAGVIGKLKGSSFWIWFLVGLVLPIFGTIAAIFSRSERGEPLRACPTCGREVALHDQVCMRCGTDLDFPQETAGNPA